MGGYIGARAGSLSTTTVANVQDVTATDTTPEVTIINNTHEDSDSGREGKVIFKGQQSGGEESTLAEIEANHHGSSDDEKGQLIIRTNDGSDGASPTERVRIDSEGNLGLNSTSPTTYVDGSAGSTLVLESSGTDRGALVFASECTGGANELLGLINFTDTANTTTNKRSAGIKGIRGSGDANAFLTFTTDNTERMRIASDGKVSVGRTTSLGNGILTVQSNNGAGLAIGYGTGTNEYRRLYHHSSGLYFESSTNQAYLTAAGAWTNASDVTLKKDIEDIDYGIEKIKKLKPRKYKMKSDDQEQIGFIAQELLEEVPEVVSGKDEILGVSYGQLTAVLTKAIQELSAKNDALEAQNTTQATQIADLITRVEALEGA